MNRLDEIKARLNEVGSHHPDVVVLVAAVEAVLELHKARPYRHHTTVTETEILETGQLRPIERCYWSDGWKCFECGPIVGPNTACPTVEAIRTALGDDT